MNRLKTIAIAGGAAIGLLAIIGGGMVFADEATSGAVGDSVVLLQDEGDGSTEDTTERVRVFDDFAEDLAAELGITTEELAQAIKNVQLADVDEALANGDIPEEMAERLRERIEESDGLIPFLPLPGFVHGHGGRGGPGLFDGFPRAPFAFHLPLEAAAEFLDITEDELRDELNEGSTLAETAVAHGSTREALKAHLVEAANARIEEKVVDGDIDEADAEALRAEAEEHIESLLDATITLRGEFRGGPFGGGRFPSDGSDDDTGSDVETGIIIVG